MKIKIRILYTVMLFFKYCLETLYQQIVIYLCFVLKNRNKAISVDKGRNTCKERNVHF